MHKLFGLFKNLLKIISNELTVVAVRKGIDWQRNLILLVGTHVVGGCHQSYFVSRALLFKL